jgi:hypothetical protein
LHTASDANGDAGAGDDDQNQQQQQQPKFTAQELKALFTAQPGDIEPCADEPPSLSALRLPPAGATALTTATAMAAAAAGGECETYTILRRAVETRLRARLRDGGGRILADPPTRPTTSAAAAVPASATFTPVSLPFDPAGVYRESDVPALAARELRRAWRDRFDFYLRGQPKSAAAVAAAAAAAAAASAAGSADAAAGADPVWTLLGAPVDDADVPASAAAVAQHLPQLAGRCPQHRGLPPALATAPPQAVRLVFSGAPTRGPHPPPEPAFMPASALTLAPAPAGTGARTSGTALHQFSDKEWEE